MPERIHAGRIYDYVEAPSFASNWYEDEPMVGLTEYIRADVAQAQLDAANARIAELEATQAWVRVDERLPEPLDDVLVSDGVTVAIGYAPKHGAWNLYGWSDLTPTHWMPLPPPPVTDVTP